MALENRQKVKWILPELFLNDIETSRPQKCGQLNGPLFVHFVKSLQITKILKQIKYTK